MYHAPTTHVITASLNNSGGEDISVGDALSDEESLVGEVLVEDSEVLGGLSLSVVGSLLVERSNDDGSEPGEAQTGSASNVTPTR